MPMPDPYLRWAQLTDYRDVTCDAQGRVGVIVECDGSVAQLQQKIVDGRLRGVQLPALYRGGAIDPRRIRCCTAWVERRHLQDLAGQVRRFKLGMAVDGHALPPSPPRGARCSARVVIGVIDDFVAFAHPVFVGADGASRVRCVWSQDATAPASRCPHLWRPAQDLGYGHELDTGAVHGRALSEAYPAVLPRATHGTHVADLAAGRWPAGARQAADVVAVHLPRRGLEDTSGSALKMQALDALHYIIERAGPQAGVVVNLSCGTMAGAHDGGSILECAIDELISLLDGRLNVVLPAGNSYEARGHAVFTLDGSCRTQTLWWQVLPDDATPSFVEIWLPKGYAASRLSVKVDDPFGRTSGWRGIGAVFPPAGTPPSRADFGVIFLGQVADSPNGPMVLVALAPTAGRPPGAARASAGRWQIALRDDAAADNKVELHAWIERDDSLPGRPQRGRQSFFIDAGGESGRATVRAAGSFNAIANGRQTIVVGGYVASTGAVARYSGGGPTRGERTGPSLLAPSEDSPTQPGRIAAATSAADSVRMNGTSVAAPQVARLIASRLAQRGGKGPPRLTPQECLDGLVPLARGKDGHDPRLGRGLLPPGGRRTTTATATDATARAGRRAPRRRRRAPDPSSAG